jgi:hypothetical protein
MQVVYIIYHITTIKYKNIKIINLIHMISILDSVFSIVLYATRWTKLDLICICFKEFLNQLNFIYIWTCLYLQQIKIYGHVRDRIMSYDHSLGWNDMLKFILLFHDPIWVQ